MMTGLVAGLVGIGAVLRLYRLDGGLWIDEVSTLVDYVRPAFGDILTTYGSQNQHFLFSVAAHASIAVFGESAWSLRLPAALFGIGSLWALWLFGREVTRPREAVLAVAMLTFSYQHIWFSQNARGYSGLLFWTLVSSYWLVRGLSHDDGRSWGWYGVAAALGLYTHLTMVFVIAGQFVVFLWNAFRAEGTAARRRTALFAGFILAGLLTAVCYAIVAPQIPSAAAADLSNVATWRSPLWMLREIGRGLAGSGLAIAAILGSIVVGAGLASLWRQSPVVPVLLLAPVVFGTASMIALGHHLWPRFFFFAAGFAILVVVRGLSVCAEAAASVLRWPVRRTDLFATVVTLVAIALLARSLPYVYRPKQDFAGARDFVEGVRRPGEAVVAVGVAAMPFRIYYAPRWQTAATLAELQHIERGSAGTWLVYTLPIELENTYPDIYAAVQRGFRLVRTFDGSLGGGAIYVWRSETRPSVESGMPQMRAGS
jgi:mannosyltransferase